MGANEKKEVWFRPALDVCFCKSHKIPQNAFGKVFAGMMTAPCRDRERTPEEIRQDQQALLGHCPEALEDWKTEETEIKPRLQVLATHLLSQLNLDGLSDYLNKHTSYKPHHYINLYLGEDLAEQRQRYAEVASCYGLLLKAVYGDCEEQKRCQYQQARAFLMEMLPDCRLEDAYSDERFGQCLAALLLWFAVEAVNTGEARDRAYQLLNIDPPEPCSTQILLSLSNVTVSMEQYVLLCTAAMRAELEVEELTGVYQTLLWIREKMGGQSDPVLHGLISTFVDAIASFGKRKTEELNADWRNSKAAADRDLANRMYETCLGWIE